jgi:hypothetical protein
MTNMKCIATIHNFRNLAPIYNWFQHITYVKCIQSNNTTMENAEKSKRRGEKFLCTIIVNTMKFIAFIMQQFQRRYINTRDALDCKKKIK